ncbi:hypothetical protein AOC06_01680 [Polynucleobacter paludilacus]|nr:hypothetical protein AOC06_01680 [Polynucleobacter paludilacus]
MVADSLRKYLGNGFFLLYASGIRISWIDDESPFEKFEPIGQEKLGIVVQGPISATTLTFLKKLNGVCIPIVFSTWRNSIDNGIFDSLENIHVIENEQPIDPGFLNLNRQIVSTFNGLLYLKDLGLTHVIKIRSDEIVLNKHFISHLNGLWNEFGYHKVISLNLPIYRPGHINDHFLAGPIDDLLRMFHISKKIKIIEYRSKWYNHLFKFFRIRDWPNIGSVETRLMYNLSGVDFLNYLPSDFLQYMVKNHIISDELTIGLCMPKRLITLVNHYPMHFEKNADYYNRTITEPYYRSLAHNTMTLNYDFINFAYENYRY